VRAAEAWFVGVELLEEGADARGEEGFGSSGTG
jgi:dUTPase